MQENANISSLSSRPESPQSPISPMSLENNKYTEFNKFCTHIVNNINNIDESITSINNNIINLKKRGKELDVNLTKLFSARNKSKYNVSKVFNKYINIFNTKKIPKHSFPISTWFSKYNIISDYSQEIQKRLDKKKSDIKKISMLSETILSFENRMKNIESLSAKEIEEKVPHTSVCKICYNNNTSFCIIPCGHMLCLLCYEKNRNSNHVLQNKCPFCRVYIKGKQKLYF